MVAVTLLDGGMGQELLARSRVAPTPLWATGVMRDHPGLVQAVHADYFAAGATVATTNSYAIHHDRLIGLGLDHEFAALHAQALAEARAARSAHGAGRIAGSLGPLVASYRPDTLPPHAEAVAKYAEIARLMAPHVDLILCETVASLAHAAAVLEGADAAGCPVWLSVTVDDDIGTCLRSGEPVAALADVVAQFAPDAILANCSAPEAMAAALAGFARMDCPFGAYANGFRQTTKDFLAATAGQPTRPDLTPARYADFALGWVDQGATIVGGCCETTPAHIAAIARRLIGAGHRIV